MEKENIPTSPTSSVWSCSKYPGVFNPPKQKDYPNLIIRKIHTNNYIDSNIGSLIGKDGNYFIQVTKKYNILYIWYADSTIRLYGQNDTELMNAVNHIIGKIKYMNYLRYK